MTHNPSKRPISAANDEFNYNANKLARKRDKPTQQNYDLSGDLHSMSSTTPTNALHSHSLGSMSEPAINTDCALPQSHIHWSQKLSHWNVPGADDRSMLIAVVATEESMDESTSSIEYGLQALRIRRLKEHYQPVYVPPMAKANLQAHNDALFSLMDKAQEFLASNRQVMLTLGDSGAGKSTFNRHLEHYLWINYFKGNPIPLFINLPTIREPQDDMIAKQLRIHGFADDQIMEMKQYREFFLICDGYDESQLVFNLHKTNRLNQLGEWRSKMIISCRTQFLGAVYRDRFVPQPADHYQTSRPDLFQEAVIAPFSKEQVHAYVACYVPLEPRPWDTADYMRMLTTIPNLMDLVKNPFLLTLTLEALPGVIKDQQELSAIRITRVQLYDHFVDQWLGVNMRRLQNSVLDKNDREVLAELVEMGFISLGIDYATRLARAIFDKQDGNPVVQYVHFSDKNSWRAEFFGPQPEVRLLRDSSPLTRTGTQYRFVHRSMLEYFFSRAMCNPASPGSHNEFSPHPDKSSPHVKLFDAEGPLFKLSLMSEHSVIQFLCERVMQCSNFKRGLLTVVEQSKTDPSAILAATNAITILVRAGVQMNGIDFRGVRIPGADLSGGQFDSAHFQGADLRGVNFARSWLRQADFSNAQMVGVRFGELPYLDVDGHITSCTYSPDGHVLALSLWNGVRFFDTTTWSSSGVGSLSLGEYERALSVAFSSDGTQVVTRNQDGTIRIWDRASGQILRTMWVHEDVSPTEAMAISPCGKRIASSSGQALYIWNAETGERMFEMEGHDEAIRSVKYSPNGSQLVSGGDDKSIRFWDGATGEVVAVWQASFGPVLCLDYSPNGQNLVSGHENGGLQVWNLGSRTQMPGPILHGHTGSITGVSFSPNGQRIGTSSFDYTLRLWDAATGTCLSVFVGHTRPVSSLSFSPDGVHIASGGGDGKMRLWETDSTESSVASNGHTSTLYKVAYSPDGLYVLSGSDDRTVRRWDLQDDMRGSILFEVSEGISSMAISLDGLHFATNSNGTTIQLRDLQPNSSNIGSRTLRGHTKNVIDFVYSPCGRWIASCSWDKSVRLWDLDSEIVLHYVLSQLPLNSDDSISRLAFSPTGLQLATGDSSGRVCVYDLQTRSLLTSMTVQEPLSSGSAHSPPRELKVPHVLGGSVRLRDYETDEPGSRLDRPSPTSAIAYSPNGQQIAVGTSNGMIQLWDIVPNKSCARLDGHKSSVICLAYSPCGGWIASGGFDNTVRLWRRHQQQPSHQQGTWSCTAIVHGFFGSITSVAWNPTVPLEFVTGCRDESVRVWQIKCNVGKGDDGDDVIVTVRQVWGSNLGRLCASGLTFKDAVGLSPTFQTLLVQRGAVDSNRVDADGSEDAE